MTSANRDDNLGTRSHQFQYDFPERWLNDRTVVIASGTGVPTIRRDGG